MTATKIIRGCGERTPGGIYSACGLSPFGTPLTEFLIDPPIPAKSFVQKSLGVEIIEINSVHHIFDVIGLRHYRNPFDFISEVAALGMSRKLSPLLDFSLLTEQSRHFLAHPRAIIHNWREYWDPELDDQGKPSWECPKHKDEHSPDFYAEQVTGTELEQCLGVCRSDIDNGMPTDDYRGVRVEGPMYSFHGLRRPQRVKPDYEVGLFMALPIQRLEVIGGTEDSADRYQRVKDEAGVDVAFCEE